MDIYYIWVKKYKNLNDFSLNLSSRIKFFYDSSKNTISQKKCGDLPRNFFPEKIDDVIALIGKNGSGKSNALELICNLLKGSKSSILSDFLLIIKDEETKNYTCYYRFDDQLPPKSRGIVFHPHPGTIDPLSVIFFSNVFDDRRNNFSKDVVDLSVNTKSTFGNQPTNPWDMDFIKEIDFLDFPNFASLDMEMPVGARISTNVFNAAYGLKQVSSPSGHIKKLHLLVRKRTKDLQPRTRLVALIQYLYFVGLVQAYSRNYNYEEKSNSPMYDIDYDVMRTMDIYTGTDEILNELIQVLHKRCVREKLFESENNLVFSHPNLSDGELLKMQFVFLAELPLLISNLQVEYSTDAIRDRSQQSFSINHTAESRKFLRGLASTMGFIRFMAFDWVGLSSGQKAYLNLFSALTAALAKIKDKNVVLCIDEGDLYLHPKWQVEFLQRLLLILPTASKAQMQLVLTSHSPLLISDLPRQNIEILGDSNGLDQEIQTFGANLYDLYAGPLFLGKLTTGLFSNAKTVEFVKMLKKPTLTIEEKKYVKSFISILGDKILKFKVEGQT